MHFVHFGTFKFPTKQTTATHCSITSNFYIYRDSSDSINFYALIKNFTFIFL